MVGPLNVAERTLSSLYYLSNEDSVIDKVQSARSALTVVSQMLVVSQGRHFLDIR